MQGTHYLQDFILEHEDDWEQLLTSAPFSLKIQRDGDYILFKYNQLESDFTLPEVREARGIIFYEPTWECVCRAFDKFGNYGESYVEPLDWEHGVTVEEKVDGSLMKVWYHNGWHLSTNGQIDAFKAATGDASCPTFGELFERALREEGVAMGSFDHFVEELSTWYTYMFELVSPMNRVVIPYSEPALYYLGSRDMYTLEEGLYREEWEDIHLPAIYPMKTLADVENAANKLPWDEEGYVCVDRNYRRCKIKSPKYVQAHYARNNNVINDKHLLDVILSGEIEEFLVYASEYRDRIEELQEMMNNLKVRNEDALADVLRLGKISRKEYADYVLKYHKTESNFLFLVDFDNILLGKDEWARFISQWNTNKWMKELHLKDEGVKSND